MLVKCFESAGQLIKFVKDLHNHDVNAFTINYRTGNQLDLFAAILKLDRNEKNMTTLIKASIGATAAYMFKFLMSSTAFKEIFKTPEQTEFLIDLLYRLLKIAYLNSFRVDSTEKFYASFKNEDERFCFGIYPFISLMNHSCAPNTHHVRYGSDNSIIVVKPIKVGEQLFVSYT